MWPSEQIYLTSRLNRFDPVDVAIREKITALILEADVICFPMGSFFSSILVNVLPRGVGRAVSQNPCPKIFIPNMGNDPELLGYSIMEQIHILIRYLLKDCTDPSPAHHVLTHILIDPSHRDYPTAPETETLARKGIQILGMDLVHPDDGSIIDEKKLIPILLSLA